MTEISTISANAVTKWPRVLTVGLLGAALLFSSTGGAVASTESVEDPVPVACEAGLDLIDASTEMSADDQESAFTCVGDLVTVTEQSGDEGESVRAVNVTEGEVVDLTDVALEEFEEVAPSYTVPEPVFDVELVNPKDPVPGGELFPDAAVTSSYRASSTNKLYWGTRSSAGRVLWSASSQLKSYSVTGQQRYSSFNITNTPLAKRVVALEANITLKQHLRAAPDPVEDTVYLRQPTMSSATWTRTSGLMNDRGAAKYYQVISNLKINDYKAKRKFNVGGNIQYPRFQCYATAVCKYPNGREAAW